MDKKNDSPLEDIEQELEAILIEGPGAAFLDLEFAKVDINRAARTGLPEAVYCAGKTPEQVSCIVQAISPKGVVICTKASEEHFAAVKAIVPEAVYHQECGLIVVNPRRKEIAGKIAVVAAGTSDLKSAKEAMFTAQALGCEAELIADVGVAGIHRTLASLSYIREAAVVIVVAGMEGALASVIAGLVAAPVVAVPTSQGYGSSFEGITALLAMMSSCSPGVAVVGIDNGFGAACVAAKMLGAPRGSGG